MEFNAAFDMPATTNQTLAVLQKWGDPTVATFSVQRAARIAKILNDAVGIPSRSLEIDMAVNSILAELNRAVNKFPQWPADPLHAVAVINEEAGELTRAVLQVCYEPGKATLNDVRTEAIQTAAMAIRFLLHLESYEFKSGNQI